MQRRRERAHPVPAKAFLHPSPEAAMLFTPFVCNHQNPPVPPILLVRPRTLPEVTSQAQNLLTSIEVKG